MTSELSGLALREAVAVKVFGYRKKWVDDIRGEIYHDSPESLQGVPCPHWESDIAAAWQVVEKAIELGYTLLLNFNHGAWWAEFADKETVYDHELEYRPTAPEAICRAALAALETKDAAR